MRVRQACDHLRDGDPVTFTCVPGRGVDMAVNGRTVVRADDHKVIDSILRAWAEPDPIGPKLHRLALKHPC